MHLQEQSWKSVRLQTSSIFIGMPNKSLLSPQGEFAGFSDLAKYQNSCNQMDFSKPDKA